MKADETEKKTDREILLQLAASLTLADHLGDVWNDVLNALRMIGIDKAELDALADGTCDGSACDWFAERGITTLNGISLANDD